MYPIAVPVCRCNATGLRERTEHLRRLVARCGENDATNTRTCGILRYVAAKMTKRAAWQRNANEVGTHRCRNVSTWGGESRPTFKSGTACMLILSFEPSYVLQNFDRSTVKHDCRQWLSDSSASNSFSAGAPPQTPRGSLLRSPSP